MSTTEHRRAIPIDRLRDDVRLLGGLVGDLLREQGGDELFAAVEHVRSGAIALRSEPWSDVSRERERSLQRWSDCLSTPQALGLVRAFGVYFHLINVAEQHHRLRVLQQRQRDNRAPDGSIAAALADLQARPEGWRRALLQRLEVHPVFTAHPSETRRRTLLHHIEQASKLVERLDAPRELPVRTRTELLDELRARVTLIWNTTEARTARPSVLEEVQSMLYLVAGPVYDVVPRIARQLAEVSGGDAGPALKFGSWVGGDRDGNPAVTADVTRAAARLAREAVLRRYREEVGALGRDLSLSQRLVGVSQELLASADRDRGALNVQAVAEWRDEPYRRKLGLMAERLRRTETGESGQYGSAVEFVADVQLVQSSLESHRGWRIARGAMQDLRFRAEAFGFHLAELEIRQHADRHRAAVSELLGTAGDSGYAHGSECERFALLEKHLEGEALAIPARALSAATREVMETFRAVSDIQASSGPLACQTLIISMCDSPTDGLAALLLGRESGLFSWTGSDRREATCRLDIVPLFETVDQLRACGNTLSMMFGNRAYRAAVRARGDRQQVMVGYSDSAKDGGYLSATWETYRAQQRLTHVCQEAGVQLSVFHGRGGSTARGGGPPNRAILGRPPEALEPFFKVTEQGETVFSRYGNPGIAERHLEQVIHALLSSAAGPPIEPRGPWVALMERLAATARSCYERDVKNAPAMLAFFQKATPFPELSTLNLGSRPVSRTTGTTDGLEWRQLRAIPWVFSWAQARINLPGWFGLGTALAAEIENGSQGELTALYRSWPFFAMALDNAQISLGTADMRTASRYGRTLAPELPEPLQTIIAEFERSEAAILAVTEQHELLERSPVLANSIKLRNPYVDALHYAQITLLLRYREASAELEIEERAALLDTIHHSINAIAAGLQSSG